MSVAPVSGSVESTLSPDQNGPGTARSPWHAELPDDMLYEVVDGQVVLKTVGAKETEIASILDQFLGSFAKLNRLGPALIEMLYRIDQATDLRRRPDVSFVSDARWPFRRRVPDVPVWDLVPDLAIEVVSPSNSANEVQRKIHEYFKAGVSRVWVVYPEEREVYVYSSPKQIQVLQVGEDLDGGELLPGFRLPLAALFEDEPEAE
jgi:Uma2 family endonuclease